MGDSSLPTVDAPEVLERFHAELKLVDFVARQIIEVVGELVPLDDLLSVGRTALLDTARRYDPTRGVPFRKYASIRVRGAMLDCMRRMAELPRRAHQRVLALQASWLVNESGREISGGEEANAGEERAEAALDRRIARTTTACALALLAADAGVQPAGEVAASNPEVAFERAELFALVRRELERLKPKREAEILRMHYLQGLTIEAIAMELGIESSWASRLHTQAVAKLASRIQALMK